MKAELTVEEVSLAYRMCGVNPISPEHSALIINLLIRKGTNATMRDCAEVRAKMQSIPNRFRPNTAAFRSYYKYRRNQQ